jgi:SAM-dependent methyltransferase
MISEHDYRSYWNQNIERWGDFYLDISHGHETLNAPPWLAAMYRATVGRLERRLMAERYARTVVFLDRFVRPGITLSDLGCGTGIFVVEALKRGAAVNAIDFAPTAIAITRDNVQRHAPSGTVNYRVADVTRDSLPLSDLALAMGLAPYIADIRAFLDNVLPTTEMLLCLYVDPDLVEPAARLGTAAQCPPTAIPQARCRRRYLPQARLAAYRAAELCNRLH